MNKVVAVVSESPRPPPVSNCVVTIEGMDVVLTDDTVRPKEFVQRGKFDQIVQSHNDLVAAVPATGSFRIVTFCSETTVIPTRKICEIATAIASKRFPKPAGGKIVPISLGFIHEDAVDDFLSLTNEQTSELELVDTYDVAELVDLIECGLGKLRRIKESVFVLHIGDEDFFEWVIVPKVDTYVQTPSLFGLSPAHRLVFVLRSLGKMTPADAQRYCNQSAVFRLVSDSLSGVATVWAFSFGTDVMFKSNAALINLASYLTGNCNVRIATRKSTMFFRRPADAVSEAMSIASAGLNDEERAEFDYLRNAVGEFSNLERGQVGSDDEYGPSGRGRSRGKASAYGDDGLDNSEDEQFFEDGEVSPGKGKGRHSGRMSTSSRARMSTKSLTGMGNEFGDEQGENFGEDEGGASSRRGGANGEEEDEEDLLFMKGRRKPKMSEEERKKKEEEEARKREEVLAQRQKELEDRQKQEEEQQELRDKIARFRKMRAEQDKKLKKDDGKKKPKKMKKASKKSSTKLSGLSALSRQTQIQARIAKLRQRQRMLEEEEEDQSEEELKTTTKQLTPYEIRDKKFTQLKLLVFRAQKAASKPGTKMQKLQDLNEEVLEAIEEAKKFRAEAKDEIAYLRDLLKYKLKEHENNQRDLRDCRLMYLEKHVGNRHMRDEMQTRDKTGPKPDDEYSEAIKYLLKKKKQLEQDIQRLKKGMTNPMLRTETGNKRTL